MTDARRCALIAIDWGTTSARAYRLDESGAVLDAKSAPLGIQAVTDRQFAVALDTLLEGWHDIAPRIACGMIGSRQGWIEAPYVACPVDSFAASEAIWRAHPATSSRSSPARAASTHPAFRT